MYNNLRRCTGRREALVAPRIAWRKISFFFALLCETMLFAARITAITNGAERKSGKKVLFYLHAGVTQLWRGLTFSEKRLGEGVGGGFPERWCGKG